MEYVIVEFPEAREVMVDGQTQGVNLSGQEFRVLMVEEGLHEVSLGGNPNYIPRSQKIVVDGTSPINPLRVRFEKVEKVA